MATKRAAASKKSPRAKKQPTPPGDAGARDSCFVIMPFAGWTGSYYDSVYRPAIEAAGLEPHRADDLFTPGTIIRDIWHYTKNARLLLADLSDRNANVFYELGLAHAIAKPVILIADSMDEVPFDLRHLRVIVYEKSDPRWGKVLGDSITAAIKEVLKAPNSAVLPTFLTVSDVASTRVTSDQREMIAIRQEIDALRREIQRPYRSVERPPASKIMKREAEELFVNMILLGLDHEAITKALISAGAPEQWVRMKLEESRKKNTELQRTLDEFAAIRSDHPDKPTEAA